MRSSASHPAGPHGPLGAGVFDTIYTAVCESSTACRMCHLEPADNTQHILHGKKDPNHIDTVQDYQHTEAWKRLIFQKATDHILRVSHVQTLRKNDTEQNSTNNLTTPN